jgi:F-type H+-transporting ATPase subunit gamma
METTEALRKRISTAQDLQSIVKTMKALAAVSIRQYERAVESLAEYAFTIELGFRVLLKRRPEILLRPRNRPEALGAVVFGTDLGMAGPFNQEIARYAANQLEAAGESPQHTVLGAIGVRGRAELEARGLTVQRTFRLPSSVSSLSDAVMDVLVEIQDWRTERGVERVVLFHNRPKAQTTYEPFAVQLLPIDLQWLDALAQKPWPTNNLPAYTLDEEALLAGLVRDYLFMVLFRAFAESLASENASRLASMQAAEKNIGERIDALEAEFHRKRQAAITEELLDVVSGFEALEKG